MIITRVMAPPSRHLRFDGRHGTPPPHFRGGQNVGGGCRYFNTGPGRAGGAGQPEALAITKNIRFPYVFQHSWG